MPKVSPVDIPINVGNQPDFQTRLGYPQLLNMFVGESGYLYCTPGLVKISRTAPDDNSRATWKTNYNGGAYICVTDVAIVKINTDGGYEVLLDIVNSGKAVQIDENENNQIGIVDGDHLYIYDQKTSSIFIAGPTNNFYQEHPISICMLNNIGIVFDSATNSWNITEPNNLNTFLVIEAVKIESQIGQGVSLETLNNNLYIFGTNGVERWVPTSTNNLYQDPFAQDMNFRNDIGAKSTNSVIRGLDGVIYFLSSQYVPTALTPSGFKVLGKPPTQGISKILATYTDVDKCAGSFWSYRGNYFYSMTFQETGVSWLYCTNSNTFSFSSDLIISAVRTYDVVATPHGLYSLTTEQTAKHRQWWSQRLIEYKGLETYRIVCSGFECKVIQGEIQYSNIPQKLELTISLDSLSWLNTVTREMGLTGQRNARVIWPMNLAGMEFTFRVDYWGDLDFTIEKCTAIIN